jgi:hypothetical protein
LRLWAWQSQSGPGVTIDPDGFAPTRADAMRCACRDAIGELLKLPNIVELDAQLPPPDFEIIDTDAYWAKLDEAVRSRMLYIAMHKEHLLEAWIAETGIKPSEASLIMAEHFDPDRGMVTKISVERRLLPIIVEDAESIRNAGRLEMLNAVLHELGETSGTFAAIGSPAITRLDLLMQQLADCFRKPGFGGRK